MTETHYLSYFVDPFHGVDPIIAIASNLESAEVVNPECLAAYSGTIITHDTWRLVDLLRTLKLRIPSRLVDIRDALKVRSGLAKDDGGEAHWDLWKAARRCGSDPMDTEALAQLLDTRAPLPELPELIRLVKSGCGALREVWEEVWQNLQATSEQRRFVEVEVPIQQIFYNRQRFGIGIDRDLLDDLIQEAETEKYDAYRSLADELNFSPDGLNYWNVASILDKTDAKDSSPYPEGSLHEYLRIIRPRSTFADKFLRFMRAKQSFSILRRIPRNSERIYPVFACFGTVTGRIRVIEPALQELNRRYRKLLVPDTGKTLRYLDFSQFEPGILAQLSQDPRLLADYNSTDLYASLSSAIYGDGEHRSLCKRIFLSYCYGMSRARLASLLVGPDGSECEIANVDRAIARFFEAYAAVANYRRSLLDELAEKGTISTLLGNRRNRVAGGPLSSKEQRWAVSQAIQGSASLIFKWGLLSLEDQFGMDSILLPMHDAVLMQFDTGTAEADENRAKQVLTSAFRHWCPDVMPRVVSAEFSADA